ncbi:DNA-(apurinic or apyrimidinic site) lyase / endonuclease III [Methanocorpusculum labreanum Z]|uniref:Endonuclease III n=1 Tax=Methanocorpusculum labreanum (strain ATCC 43576 / DSM 4855 / Z) TaxID=410358 RepID=A2SS67_METLZ|nr:endonuclease III [Methanocorpusculum labreanum]ABN07173.1 DNA-(apurinic or apyrimidinic site) lyase / endonuclease III [Methanocorpusculum labreanum Z]
MNAITAESILEELDHQYPCNQDEMNFLKFRNPFELLIMTILSAQTTDVTINGLRDELFSAYPNPAALARADPLDVERIIHSAGFYHSKAKNIIGTAKMLEENFGGVVPRTIEELTTLPGVGRKTANIVTNHAFHEACGIAVDTHVRRLSKKIGFTQNTDPEKIEKDLMKLFPEKWWSKINYLLIRHGRAVCTAKKPDCMKCIIRHNCQSYINSGEE